VKNIPRLLRIFSRLPEDLRCKLWIVGDGPEFASLKQLTADLGLSEKVRLWGAVGNPADLLRQMHIFAITSGSEQMPTSVLEAMASGLPVVGTDVGDTRQMVTPQNAGCIVNQNDEETLYKRLLQLVTDAELRKELGRHNRKKCVSVYSSKAMIENYRNLFESAIRAA
jgi:glycosyltransferase involved in cell wall biosynthesis